MQISGESIYKSFKVFRSRIGWKYRHLRGANKAGETLYIGRANHKNSLVIDNLYQTHGNLYVPFGGKEISIRNYEVLVR